MNPLEGIAKPFKIYELRKRILFTLGMIAIYRVGSFIPSLGVNPIAFQEFFQRFRGTMAGLANIFTGGALERFSIFALGIMPYISASIIMSLMVHIAPSLEKIQKEGGEEGRRKITQYTRYLTVVISIIQSFGISIWLETVPHHIPIVPYPGLGFKLMTVIVMSTGALFVMWLGEQITERGIGNGASILIFASIITAIPPGFVTTMQGILTGQMNVVAGILLFVVVLLIIAGVVIMIQGHRKISVQYAKRIVGRRVYGGQSSYLPMQINMAGVIPIIFASSILTFPATIGAFFGPSLFDWIFYIPGWIRGSFWNLLYAGLTIFFVYFYISIIFNPNDVADNLRKSGGFVPGIRPGKPTADYLHLILNRITFVGAIFLAIIAILPDIVLPSFHAPFYFGGTSILIVVGVALDTLRQIESYLMMHHYEGFLKKARIRGRF
ncbi:TPA: preprotein translocase subunit SecY [bacterium]|nr:preprotein translocase subunit SecY [bacterium]